MATTSSESCDPERLESSLRQELTATELQVLEQHLESCPHCRLQLEQLAAADEFWLAATRSLQSVQAKPREGLFTAAGDYSDPAVSDSASDEATQRILLQDETGEPASGDTQATHFLQGIVAPSNDPRMLGRVGPYDIVSLVGQGGMGVVLKGIDRPLDRLVAVKVMFPHHAHDSDARRRFEREARAAAAISHPNVTAIHSVSEFNGLPYLVMPFVDGQSLQKHIETAGPLPLTEVLRIGHQVALGLAAAHARGLIHRDIKPANILLEAETLRLQITDFGVARVTDDASQTANGIIAGTPQYMSPEQAVGKTVDFRSDLFSLGSMLYATLTGHPPFPAETSLATLRRITEKQPRPIRQIRPETPPWMIRLLELLHEKLPENRLQTADEVAQVCDQCLRHIQQPDVFAIPPILKPQASKPRWRFAATIVAATAFIMLGGFATYAFLKSNSAEMRDSEALKSQALKSQALKSQALKSQALLSEARGADQQTSSLSASHVDAGKQLTHEFSPEERRRFSGAAYFARDQPVHYLVSAFTLVPSIDGLQQTRHTTDVLVKMESSLPTDSKLPIDGPGEEADGGAEAEAVVRQLWNLHIRNRRISTFTNSPVQVASGSNPSFHGSGNSVQQSGHVVMTSSGKLLDSDVTVALPFALGNLSEALVRQFPSDRAMSWKGRRQISVSDLQEVLHPVVRRPPQIFPAFPFDSSMPVPFPDRTPDADLQPEFLPEPNHSQSVTDAAGAAARVVTVEVSSMVEAASENRVIIFETFASTPESRFEIEGTCLWQFDLNSGRIVSCNLRQTVTDRPASRVEESVTPKTDTPGADAKNGEASDGATGLRRLNIELLIEQISEADANQWKSTTRLAEDEIGSGQIARNNEPNEFMQTDSFGPLNELDERQLVDDLTQQRKAYYWIQRIAELELLEMNQAMIDAITPYLDSSDPALSTLAEKALGRIPSEKINPFRFVNE